ncbi:MAG TPA: hypothetical protein VLF90_00800 [Patescibacteria group bacterium]|nr:hypothetical protein [Patescibacteria group bacterium]
MNLLFSHRTSSTRQQSGSIIVSILVVTLFLTTVISALAVLANSNLSRARGRVMLLQAQYAAESGADAAIATLNGGNNTYTGTGGTQIQLLKNNLYKSTYTVTVAAGSNDKQKIVTATGRVYVPANSSQANYSRTIGITAVRTSTTTSSSVVSRNILELQSGVKNLFAKDIYVNGYINTNKNTTNIVAENITVAGKNTGASNCSIGGPGNLVKPASFTDPTQTKTNINMAFNNCINPPGNSSNASFNVTANQGSISTIQSTYIPWSQYMDASYTNANNCNDWTTGAFPRNIPGPGNSKKSHYPDSGSNISTSCGNMGDLSLATGQYNITDNVHLRANLCAATACTPTFNNTSGSLKFVFVEGTINFDSIQSTPGSSPIVFIAYGTDPASKTGVCPYGGSIYLGNNGTSNAPAVYLLATNGICLDKTKWSASPALGGVSGKNIYIATNPGTPFDLKLDPVFPTNQIPVDLAWRASDYHRL